MVAPRSAYEKSWMVSPRRDDFVHLRLTQADPGPRASNRAGCLLFGGSYATPLEVENFASRSSNVRIYAIIALERVRDDVLILPSETSNGVLRCGACPDTNFAVASYGTKHVATRLPQCVGVAIMPYLATAGNY